MFQDDNAEEAMNYYTSFIEDSQITSIFRYGDNESGKEGTIMQATFTLKVQEFMCIDSNVKHQFSLTPSFSIFVTCITEVELCYKCTSRCETKMVNWVVLKIGDLYFNSANLSGYLIEDNINKNRPNKVRFFLFLSRNSFLKKVYNESLFK